MRALSLFVVVVFVRMFLPSPAISQPSPPDCIVPCGFNLVAMTGGIPAFQGEFTIVVNEAPGVPIPFSEVVIDFSGCVPDISICVGQPFPGVTSACVAPVGVIGGTADALGVVTFRILGGADNVGAAGPAAGFGCAAVFANDGAGTPFVPLGTMNVGALDQNSVGGVNPVDISLWLSDVFSLPFEGRSDYNCSGAVNPADLAFLLGVALSGTSVTSCGIYCF